MAKWITKDNTDVSCRHLSFIHNVFTRAYNYLHRVTRLYAQMIHLLADNFLPKYFIWEPHRHFSFVVSAILRQIINLR